MYLTLSLWSGRVWDFYEVKFNLLSNDKKCFYLLFVIKYRQKGGNNMRKIYEKFNIYIYFIIPFVLCIGYALLTSNQTFDLNKINNYQEHKFEFVLTMLGALLTIYGFMISLPENKFRTLMRRYKHDEIINNTIFSGIIGSLIFIILYLLELLPNIQNYLFITLTTEVSIASVKIYMILRAMGKIES